MSTDEVIAEALTSLRRNWEIPEGHIVTVGRSAGYGRQRRTMFTLPNDDADELAIISAGTTAIVRRETCQGLLLDELTLSNPRTLILRAVLDAFVAEALADQPQTADAAESS